VKEDCIFLIFETFKCRKKRCQKRRCLKRPKTRGQMHWETHFQACVNGLKNAFTMPFLKSRDSHWTKMDQVL
jgi:hypothetical protein